jgi:hypothetical protein
MSMRANTAKADPDSAGRAALFCHLLVAGDD